MRLLAALALLALAPLAGCSTPAPQEPATVVVRMVDDAFDVARVEALPNQRIEWRNEGNHTHAIVASDLGLGTPDIKPGQVGRLRFGELGTHAVHCAYHPSMTMEIVVVRG